jgi:CRISPR-associated protein Cmr4
MKTLYLHALSPVHAGTGQASAGIVDLPIAREKATNWPMIPGTSIKGVLRDEEQDEARRDRFFGTPENKKEEKLGNAGEVPFGDARILCFPVRSWQGTFAYATCPMVLKRFLRDSKALGATCPVEAVPSIPDNNTALVAEGSSLVADGTIWLQDLKFNAETAETIKTLGGKIAESVLPADEKEDFVNRFIVVSDEVFAFLCETAVEITAHIKLQDDTKTVQKGGLWYVESVPAEAIFTAFVGAAFDISSGTVLQFGGDENTGRGLCRLRLGGNSGGTV